MNKVLFSKSKDDWETPQELFDELDTEFNFFADLAAQNHNTKCPLYCDDFLEQEDYEGLGDNFCWCNPPYSKAKDFVKKISELNINCVMLLAARTDTKYFHKYIYRRKNVEIRFIQGRLKFSNHKNSAPFPSMVVIFRRIIGDFIDGN